MQKDFKVVNGTLKRKGILYYYMFKMVSNGFNKFLPEIDSITEINFRLIKRLYYIAFCCMTRCHTKKFYKIIN